MSRQAPLLAVLIDADNTSAKWAKAIFEEIASFGEASLRRVYGDFSSSLLAGWTKELAEHGLVPHQQSTSTKGKNSTDIALVIDAMDIMHAGRFDGFVLVSSDSDFTRLASRIREQGLDVFGVGQKKTPVAFRKSCKRFVFVENLLAGVNEKENPTTKLDVPSKARKIIATAIRAIDNENEWVGLSLLGKQINSANSDFDPRNYGNRNLSTLIEKAGGFELKTIDGSLKARIVPK